MPLVEVVAVYTVILLGEQVVAEVVQVANKVQAELVVLLYLVKDTEAVTVPLQEAVILLRVQEEEAQAQLVQLLQLVRLWLVQVALVLFPIYLAHLIIMQAVVVVVTTMQVPQAQLVVLVAKAEEVAAVLLVAHSHWAQVVQAEQVQAVLEPMQIVVVQAVSLL
jgi:hypothetical protein